MLVAHRPGSGKTLAAIFTALELLLTNRITSVFILVPQGYWENEVNRVLGGDDDTKQLKNLVTVLTHRKGLNDMMATGEGEGNNNAYRQKLPTAMLIVDEAHNMRTKICLTDEIRQTASIAEWSKMLRKTMQGGGRRGIGSNLGGNPGEGITWRVPARRP